MLPRSLRRLGRLAIGGCAAALLALAPALVQAQSPGDVQTLQARLDRLERQNAELLKLLQEGGIAPAQAAQGAADKNQVEKIVSDYLKAQDAKKKEDEDKKKKEADLAGYEVGKDFKLNARWNHGLEFETADKAFRVHVGGRTQVDGAWVSADNEVQFGQGGIGRLDDGVGFRRGRFTIDGTFYEVIDFIAEYDFVNSFDTTGAGRIASVVAPTDLWAQISKIPVVGHVRIGNQKPWIGFEHMMSSRFLTFMERSLGFDAFMELQNNGFEPGITVWNYAFDDRVTWGVGAFKSQANVFGFNVGDGDYEVTGRVTWLPWYEHNGRCLLHLGLGASHRDPDNSVTRYRARTEIRNGPAVLHNIIAEARMLADGETRINPEIAMNLGPLTIQAEYTAVWTTDAIAPDQPPEARVARGDVFYQAAYLEVHYFLTGEHRPYALRGAYPHAFTRVIPNENYFCVDGCDGAIKGKGAWQVAVRYSWLDLDDKGISGPVVAGAVIHDWTFGLNWYLNPNMKIQWNYSIAERMAIGDKSDGTIQGFGTRLAIDF